MEKMTGKSISQRERTFLTRGADEVDLVRSGLEETMINSYDQIMEYFNRYKRIEDLHLLPSHVPWIKLPMTTLLWAFSHNSSGKNIRRLKAVPLRAAFFFYCINSLIGIQNP